MTTSEETDRSPESGSARTGKPKRPAHDATSRASNAVSHVPSPASTSAQPEAIARATRPTSEGASEAVVTAMGASGKAAARPAEYAP